MSLRRNGTVLQALLRELGGGHDDEQMLIDTGCSNSLLPTTLPYERKPKTSEWAATLTKCCRNVTAHVHTFALHTSRRPQRVPSQAPEQLGATGDAEPLVNRADLVCGRPRRAPASRRYGGSA